MAVVKFVNAGSPMNNIFDYVTRREATERKLISGVNCSPESALEEFRFVKKRFHKEDGRSYYHIVQSFSPDDDLTPETAHEIGLKFAEYFKYPCHTQSYYYEQRELRERQEISPEP